MKITKNQLRKIIKEECTNTLAEQERGPADKVTVKTGDLLDSEYVKKEYFDDIAQAWMKNRPKWGDLTALHILNAMVRSVSPNQGEGGARGGFNNFEKYLKLGEKGGEPILKVQNQFAGRNLYNLAYALENQAGKESPMKASDHKEFDQFIEVVPYEPDAPTKRADGSPPDGEGETGDLEEKILRKVGSIKQAVRKELKNRKNRAKRRLN